MTYHVWIMLFCKVQCRLRTGRAASGRGWRLLQHPLVRQHCIATAAHACAVCTHDCDTRHCNTLQAGIESHAWAIGSQTHVIAQLSWGHHMGICSLFLCDHMHQLTCCPGASSCGVLFARRPPHAEPGDHGCCRRQRSTCQLGGRGCGRCAAGGASCLRCVQPC